MRIVKTIALLGALAALAAGCKVTELHPLFTPGERVFQPTLLGTWTSQAGGAQWRVSRGKDRSYVFAWSGNGLTRTCQAVLGRSVNDYFLEFGPARDPLPGNPLEAPLYLLAKLQFRGSEVALSFLDAEVLRNLARARAGGGPQPWGGLPRPETLLGRQGGADAPLVLSADTGGLKEIFAFLYHHPEAFAPARPVDTYLLQR